jgi:hypothetical protein
MREAIERFFFESRWRRDEYAWRVWQEVEPLIPRHAPSPGGPTLMAGRVVRIYQRARRGSKAVVNFGPAVGALDTWWEHARPPVGKWVIVHAHPWFPPGTHSGQMVLWVDHWQSWAPGDTETRARRHQRRQEKLAARSRGETLTQ